MDFWEPHTPFWEVPGRAPIPLSVRNTPGPSTQRHPTRDPENFQTRSAREPLRPAVGRARAARVASPGPSRGAARVALHTAPRRRAAPHVTGPYPAPRAAAGPRCWLTVRPAYRHAIHTPYPARYACSIGTLPTPLTPRNRGPTWLSPGCLYCPQFRADKGKQALCTM